MSTTWYAKLESTFHANRKVMTAGRLGREVYVFVLCMNAHRGQHGYFSADDLAPWYIAYQMQIPEDDAAAGVRACVNAGLIEFKDGLVYICGWDEHYGKRPLTGAERQAKHRSRRKPSSNESNDESVTSNDDECDSNETKVTVTEVQKEGTEGREGASLAPFDPTAPGALGKLADSVWLRLSDIRIALAAEFGIGGVLPFTPVTPASANQRGYRDLVTRLREEGTGAPGIANRVLEVLTAQARSKRSLEWVSEKAFSEGAWRTARESVPKWRSAPVANDSPRQVMLDGVLVDA